MKLTRRFNRISGEQYFLDRAVIYGISCHKKKITSSLGAKNRGSFAMRIMLMEGGEDGWQFLNKPVLFAPKRRKR